MTHIVLLGDSIFDNAPYVPRGTEVIRQLTQRIPADTHASLVAVDGSVMSSIDRQLARVPPDATHLVVSVGGNDALRYSGVLDHGARSMAEAIDKLAAISDEFQRDYHAMLESVLARGLPVAVCTIYYPRFPDPHRQRLAVTALSIPNDAIIRVAIGAGVPFIDLRLVCNRDEDYANPIEPSATGGAKIAAMIARLVGEHDFPAGRTVVYV